ncbi:MAG: selenium-dependent molybdenum cofactor biosynthesis protein YqeB, partial [Chloroflexota bacterium]
MTGTILIRGGGDLASGVALRLHRAGLKIVITELAEPMVVRRLVSYAQAVFTGECTVEDTVGKLVRTLDEVVAAHADGQIPIIVDPDADITNEIQPVLIIDARMTKTTHKYNLEGSAFIVGLGPGFMVEENCTAAIETQRGHSLGRVIWEGSPEKNTGIASTVSSYGSERVLRAPTPGKISTHVNICDRVRQGDLIANISGEKILAPFDGVVRGLLYDGIVVKAGTKFGDIDP